MVLVDSRPAENGREDGHPECATVRPASTSSQHSHEEQINGEEPPASLALQRPPQVGKPRAIKTPLQKEALEAAFHINPFPGEEVRRALGERIKLTEQQVQVWFSHRRRREKKVEPHAGLPDQAGPQQGGGDSQAPAQQPSLVPPPSSSAAPLAAHDAAGVHIHIPAQPDLPKQMAQPLAHSMTPPVKPASLPAGQVSSRLPAQLLQPAFPGDARLPTIEQQLVNLGAPAPAQPAMTAPPQPTSSGMQYHASMQHDNDSTQSDDSDDEAVPANELQELLDLARSRMEVEYAPSGPAMAYFFDRRPEPAAVEAAAGPCTELGQKRKLVHLDGYDIDTADGAFHARKRPTPTLYRSEADKEDRKERRKVEAEQREVRKFEAQRAKDAERVRTVMQREARKQEAALEKEKKAEERKRQAEDRKKEKEMAKALAAQEKEVLRMRQREAQSGPRDDLDVEWQNLLDAQRNSDEYMDVPEEHIPPPQRPAFPPATLRLQPAFPAQLQPHSEQLLHLWGFLHSFGDILGMSPLTLEELAAALTGASSHARHALARLHIALLRLLQADMEESHATGAMQTGGAANFIDQAVRHSAQVLEETWIWGLDIDAWRAHLSPLTWPEVLRQWAIAAGHGRRRPKPRKVAKPKLGTEGEDTTTDANGKLLLRLPPRFGPHTVKGAAWQVLMDQGPNGLNIAEIARRIQRSGLRDLSTSKTPEASVVAALSRDIIFARVAPGTYALQAVVSHHQRQALNRDTTPQAQAQDAVPDAAPLHAPPDTPATPVAADGQKSEPAAPAQQQSTAAFKPEAGVAAKTEPEAKAAIEEEHDEDEEDEEEDEEEGEDELAEAAWEGAAWVRQLATHEYSELGLDVRLDILATLIACVLEGPTLRACLDMRMEENQRIRRQMFEEARVEKKQRQAEQAAKSRAAAEEAQRQFIEKYGAPPPGMAPLPPAPTPPATPAPAEGDRGDEDEELLSATAQRQRQQQRAETVRRAEELNAARTEPLGQDRRHNKYWRFFVEDHPGGDPGAGRLYIESASDGSFQVLTQLEDLTTLMEALERRGAREERLFAELLRVQDSLQQHMPAGALQLPSAHADVSQRLGGLSASADSWLASVHLHASGSAPGAITASSSPAGSAFDKLQGDLNAMERALPREALQAGWDAPAWHGELGAAGSAAELRGLLGRLEEALHTGWVSPHFPRKPLLVLGAWLPIGKEVASALLTSSGEVQQLSSSARHPSAEPQAPPSVGSVSPSRSHSPAPASASPQPLAWLPATTAALALRLYALDAALVYSARTPPARDNLQGYNYVQRPALAQAAVAVASNGTTIAPQQLHHIGTVAKQASAGHSGRSTLPGLAISAGGRPRHMAFPAFPQAALQGPGKPFTFAVQHMADHVGRAIASSTLATADAVPVRPARLQPRPPPPAATPLAHATPPASLRPPLQAPSSSARGPPKATTKGKRSGQGRGMGDSRGTQASATPGPSNSLSRARSMTGASEEDDEYDKSTYGQHDGAGMSDEEMEDAIPAFQEHEVDISDSD